MDSSLLLLWRNGVDALSNKPVPASTAEGESGRDDADDVDDDDEDAELAEEVEDIDKVDRVDRVFFLDSTMSSVLPED